MPSSDDEHGFDRPDETGPAVDAYVRTTASGTGRCVIFERSGFDDAEGLGRWLSADEGWYVDRRAMR